MWKRVNCRLKSFFETTLTPNGCTFHHSNSSLSEFTVSAIQLKQYHTFTQSEMPATYIRMYIYRMYANAQTLTAINAAHYFSDGSTLQSHGDRPSPSTVRRQYKSLHASQLESIIKTKNLFSTGPNVPGKTRVGKLCRILGSGAGVLIELLEFWARNSHQYGNELEDRRY